jgi:serine/threonine-protein kinase PpkA
LEIPGYRIEQLLAEGGMASVYLAIQESLDRRVALKLLRKFDQPEQSERFVNEGRIIASLNHRNIITIHDIGSVDGQHFIAMEYLTGGDLDRRIMNGLAPDAAIEVTRTLGRCLDFLHRQGIIHRDIKPANILFRDDETPILTDFGIAKQLNRDASLTMDGTAMGSPDYLSPEQAECKTLDGRADLYSLGIVLYEMLTGAKPYQRASYIETVMAHITAPIPDLPRPLKRYQELVDRMIAKSPADRFASAAELVAYIDSIAQRPPAREFPEKIAGLVRRLQGAGRAASSPAPTLEIPQQGARQEASPGADGTADARPGTPPGTAGGRLRHLLIAGGLLLLVAGSVLMLARQPGEAPGEGARVEVEQHLADARAALQSDQLTAPADDNAYLHYQRALALEPGNQEAVAGIAEIARRHAAMAEADMTQANFAAAKTHVEDGLGVAPENARLLALQRELADLATSEIERYLLQAQAALDAYRLTTPAEDSAYFYYQQALALSPGHAEALQGIDRIADRYADLAERNIDQYNYSQAKVYVRKGLDLRPGHQRLLALQERTSAAKDVPGRIFRGIKSIFE